ncbi:MAG: phosphoribosyl-ATP diphosphatase [Oscillospiraceae bacterium]|jgi:phosphoribosyl-ATP pyrophosphohydrolase|nr:phosphoribosyl-ATP diphosphatase [Oscillospiraceae bacterium]
MNDTLLQLEQTALERKAHPTEKSYTCYLFEQGIDKILKKCGEEAAEMIIAAKNSDNKELSLEISDLLYHIVILCAERGLPVADVFAELDRRSAKSGNLKDFKQTDKNT